MGTLTIQGIVWNCSTFNGKVSFCFQAHCIIFDSLSRMWVMKENGEPIFADRSRVHVLEHAAELVWEYHANQIVPSWAA